MEQTATNTGFGELLLLAVFLIPAILFLVTQQNTLRLIRPENRLLQPGLVWLQAVPLLGMVWQFVVIARIAGSIQKQLQAGADDSILGYSNAAAAELSGKKPTLVPGLIYSTVYCSMLAGVVLTNVLTKVENLNLFMIIVGLLSMITLVFWIVYWVSLAGYQRMLKKAQLAI